MRRPRPQLIFIFIIILLALFFGIRYQTSPSEFTCIANYIQHNRAAQSRLLISYIFGKKEGYLDLDGVIKMDNHGPQILSRRVVFTYHHDGSNYYLRSVKNTRFPADEADDKILNRLFAPFYLQPDKELFMRIHFQRSGLHLFSVEPVTTFACKQMRE